MRLLAPAFKFHFKGGRRTMILSVLSSPALVSGLMVVRAKNPVHSVLFPILVFCDTSGLLILLGLDFSAMISPVVHIGAIAVSFLFVVIPKGRFLKILRVCCNSMYIYIYLSLPRQINRVLFGLTFSFLTLKLLLLLLNLTSPLFAAEALVFASSYSGAGAPVTSMGMTLMDDLSRAVAPYLPRGGEAPVPVNLPEERPLTMAENARLAFVINFQNEIGALLKGIDATSLISYHFAEESIEDLAASTLQHNEEELNDPQKLWIVREGLRLYKNSSRYYWRAVHWVRAERQVRNGDLSVRFIIEDDGEG